MSSRHRLIFFLVDVVSFILNNLTAFFIIESFTEGCMLIASTDNIVTLSIFTSSSSGLSFRSDAYVTQIDV